MQRFSQSPTDPGFVQNPYPFYDRIRAAGDLAWWDEYAMPCAASHCAVHAILRDRRFGREVPPEVAPEIPNHLAPFYKVEAHSMLELEPPRHTRLRGLVLRAFTSRRIKDLSPEITALTHLKIDTFPKDTPFEILTAFCQPIPVIVIARLLGVPDDMAPQLLRWSNAMVAMYQASRTRATEDAAAQAARDFSDFLRRYIDTRRNDPRDDLITHLIAAEEEGEKLSTDELITTCILLLNAGHEATVHTLGNGIKTLLETGTQQINDQAVEEILRFDPPLHMFTRYAYDEVTLHGHTFQRGDQVALLLAAANHDPDQWPDAHRFAPTRPVTQNTSFGGGLHFCVGAPLARLELQIALPILWNRCPKLRIAEPPVYANTYHFHGLERLMVQTS
ncbi:MULTISPECIES: cytochrome P450 [Marivita]|uniref:Cytochrome P450 n=1 Tax=Marivita cryptomonadis TaxID=505252 RepID=A0A9Q2S0J0_9RHOB|nr:MULTISPECIES: cytochrome P450 [Marivita]MCR9168905.1 cytochrome P450 [Paracoccaceae bacterium]MBM2322447.1 cytochrome P450 [Marivita cryptomonadis]MBM2332029.1 cytochrome P450 [Marivita cryptomonadis]MBM2341613.1 cytochrome P450 [Marivita cryptomonadis]MBM2346277.1 cytochrome P450 [Marivita cryptomonadis]